MTLQSIDAGAMTWNFFIRRDSPELWCAVPAERSVPRFLISEAWRFGGHRGWPGGFNPLSARESDRLNGFYLFHHLPSAGGQPVRG